MNSWLRPWESIYPIAAIPLSGIYLGICYYMYVLGVTSTKNFLDGSPLCHWRGVKRDLFLTWDHFGATFMARNQKSVLKGLLFYNHSVFAIPEEPQPQKGPYITVDVYLYRNLVENSSKATRIIFRLDLKDDSLILSFCSRNSFG